MNTFSNPTILIQALTSKNTNYEIIKALVESGLFDLNLDSAADNPLYRVFNCIKSKYFTDDYALSLVELLIDNGANPNVNVEISGWSILMYFSIKARPENETRVEILRYLLEHGADLNFVSTDGYTPLRIAEIWDCYMYIKIMKEHGATK